MIKYEREFLAALYKAMVRIRLAEESLVDPIINHEIKCPCHLYSGQEAVATGVCAALNKDDLVFGNHRSHGHYLAKGGDLGAMIGEIYGLDSGCSGGRGGSMHVIDVEYGMMGAAPIVGGTISLATGAALASKIRDAEQVAVSFFGDGATGEGALYESLNFASLKKLPIIFVCENNLYSTHMPIGDCRPDEKIFKIAKPFGIKAFRIDGNDVLKVYKTSQVAVDLCRKGEGPVFIECSTYRLRGHVGPDDCIQGTRTDIRPKEEIERWKRKDPILRFRKMLLKEKLFTSDQLDAVESEIEDTVKQAHSASRVSSHPEGGDLLDYVFK